jgi:hypothetical protein
MWLKAGVFNAEFSAMETTMLAVNMLTRCMGDVFLAKADEVEFDIHPYCALTQTLKKVGEEDWTPETRKTAIEAIATWIRVTVGNSCAAVLNEILEVAAAAERADENGKQAADEVRGSMKFLEICLTGAIREIDAEYIAEKLFEHGCEKAARLKAAQPTVKKIHNWVSRISPSLN